MDYGFSASQEAFFCEAQAFFILLKKLIHEKFAVNLRQFAFKKTFVIVFVFVGQPSCLPLKQIIQRHHLLEVTTILIILQPLGRH